MNTIIPKISVLIICYKQEELIKRTINSLIAQKNYIYEICVSDDCSPDNTWDVLQEYDKEYPGLFKLHRNNPNVGIFENIEYTWTMPSGDVIYQLAGDDEVGEGWFKVVADYIQDNNIDYKNDLFCIYGNYKCVYPSGDSLLLRNDLAGKKFDAVQLALRGLISNRSSCFSSSILRKFKKVSQGRSHISEQAIDIQIQLYSKNNYYINRLGNIYYSKIGVSTQINSFIYAERRLIRPYAVQFLQSEGVKFSQEDLSAISKNNIYSIMEKPNHTFFEFVKAFWDSYDKKIGLRSIKLKQLIFASLKRIPHKTPIEL